MKYIAFVELDNNNIETLVFGYTEDHYINRIGESNQYDCHLIHVYYAIFYGNVLKNKRFDPGDNSSIWTIKKNYIFNTFDGAKIYFFNKLFQGVKR